MLDIFSGLRLVVKRRQINIDNAIFRCHWFFTSTLLVSFSLIITARQYVGQPIECHSVDKLPDSLLNSYCWVQSTFSIPQACNRQQVGIDVPYPCIDNSRGREVKVYAYYQWVGIVLFVQGLLFHLPYYLWKLWENGLIKAITGGLRVAVLNEQERVKKKEIVVEYIHNHLGCHNRYALKYFVCEFICLVNLLAQLWATNKFFDGQFLRYGLDVVQYSSSFESQSTPPPSNQPSQNLSKLSSAKLNNLRQVDPMTFIFPRITKCTYYDFGPSGDVQKHDALCLLPLNIINEKIYVALWFWFLTLAILTLLVIIYRIFAIASESVRCKGLMSRCKLSNELDVQLICRHCDVGDWFLFYMVAENLDPLIMREIISAIASKIREHLELKADLSMLHSNSFGAGGCDEAEQLIKRAIQLNADEQESSANKLNKERLKQLLLAASSATGTCSSRRSSAASVLQAHQQSLALKLKKRLYNKRMWSSDLSAQQAQLLAAAAATAGSDEPTPPRSSALHLASAPPASQMPLGGAPRMPPRAGLTRRLSLARLPSNSSSGVSTRSLSFVMDIA